MKVAWATANGVKFLAQSGGHGWTSSFKIGEGDIIINLRGMRDVTVDLATGKAVIAAGALTGEFIAEAHKNKAHVGRSCLEYRVPFSLRTILTFQHLVFLLGLY
jgi:FAD/FMN-containing dehydrogenase